MIKSMTGFGKAECNLPNKKITVEVKSLNSKNLDLFTKIPSFYKEKELEIRNKVANILKRGKVEVGIYYELTEGSKSSVINQAIVQGYFEQLKSVANNVGVDSNEILLQTVMRLPDVLKQEREEINEAEWAEVMNCIDNALKAIEEFRNQEGKSLEKDVKERISTIQSLIPEVEKHEGTRLEKVKQKLRDNLKELLPDNEVDNNRFEQELIFYLEKLDISEEKVRLRNHCEYFLQTVSESEANGKKLGFISQEIGREINTMGSKANDSDIQKIVVLMKDELEKIKEQVLNIL